METSMLPTVKSEFPNLFTKKGVLKKKAPIRFDCTCGHHFTKTSTARLLDLVFSIHTCPECGKRVKESPNFSVWKRMMDHQIEAEDFILETVLNRGAILKDDLKPLIQERFGKENRALGFLVYFGYLKVDIEKRDTLNIVEYTINPEKVLNKRYERIQ